MASKCNTNDQSSYDDGWEICLHTAASLGILDSLQDYIERQNLSVDMQNRSGYTALMYSCFYGQAPAVSYLIKNHAQLNILNNDGHTALMLASMSGHSTIVQLLLENKCSLELCDRHGWSPLFYATLHDFDNIVLLLVKYGANVNRMDRKYGYTPLMIAAKEGLEVIAHTLIHSGSDQNLKSFCGDTAHSLALNNKHLHIVDMLDAKSTPEQPANILTGPLAVEKMLLQRSHIPPIKNTDSATKSMSPSNINSDLNSFLDAIGLSKYFQLFVDQEVDLPLLLSLTDADLQEIGIKNLGPRKKIVFAIQRYRDRACVDIS